MEQLNSGYYIVGTYFSSVDEKNVKGVKVKICFLSSMHTADDKRVHDKEARSLVAAGFDVSHICPGESDSRRNLDGVNIRSYVSRKGLRGRILQLHYLYRLALEEDSDAYHCNEVDSWAVGVALKIFRKKICVFDVHEHYPSAFAESRFPVWLQPAVAGAVRLLFMLFLPFTDKIILAKRTVSDDFKCSDDKKVLVRNFTLKGNLAFTTKGRIRDLNDPMIVVHFGFFNKLRGWPQTIDALAKVDERVHLQIIGAINDGSIDEFKARVKSLNLESRVEFLDWMPFDEAFKYLTKAHVGLIAFQPHVQNHIYAMPHKLFDYMAAGLSVLIPKQAVEVAPIVKESACGLLIDPSDVDDIRNGLKTLLDDPVRTNCMGERGQQAVFSTYNWEKEAERLIEAYKGLLVK